MDVAKLFFSKSDIHKDSEKSGKFQKHLLLELPCFPVGVL